MPSFPIRRSKSVAGNHIILGSESLKSISMKPSREISSVILLKYNPGNKSILLLAFSLLFFMLARQHNAVQEDEILNNDLPIFKKQLRKPIIVDKLAMENEGVKTWVALSPWDAPPSDFYDEDTTGSFVNCKTSFTKVHKPSISFDFPTPDDGTLIISCHNIFYRAPRESIRNAGKLVIGVLSSAGGDGPNRRNYIRSTWASRQYFDGTFFLVAGAWEDVKGEFMFYRDLIWIDEEEIYDGEESVLPYKTISFFGILNEFAKPIESGGFIHAIKTDDDSYVNIENLKLKLQESESGFNEDKLHYFGHCPQFHVLPSRDKSNKWPVTYQTYPEPKFPLYCQGAGFGLSRHLLNAAIENDHFATYRYMPFEDVSIGILAERSGFKPAMINGIHVFRADTPKERLCVNQAIPMEICYKDDLSNWPPDAKMNGKLIQHRVTNRDDMISIHRSLGLPVRWVEVPK